MARCNTGRVPVVTFVNNHFAGYGIETAGTLRGMVDEGGEAVPL